MAFIALILAAIMTVTPITTSVSEFVGDSEMAKSIVMELKAFDKDGQLNRVAVSGLIDKKSDYAHMTIEYTDYTKEDKTNPSESLNLVYDTGVLYLSAGSMPTYMMKDGNKDSNFVMKAYDEVFKSHENEHLVVIDKNEIERDVPDRQIDNMSVAIETFNNEFISKLARLDAVNNIVKINRNTLTIKVNPQTLVEYLKGIAKYLNDNPTVFSLAIDKSVNSLIGNNNIVVLGENTYTKEEVLLQAENAKSSFAQFVESFYSELYTVQSTTTCENDNCVERSTLADEILAAEGSALDVTIKKTNKELDVNGKLVLNNSDEDVTLDIMAHSKDVTGYTKKSVKIFGTLEDGMAQLNKAYNKYDPITTISVEWRDYDSNTGNFANVFMQRFNEDGSLKTQDFESYQIYAIDGRIYLPMRALCEAMGEIVEWDQATAKAYVVRDNEKIEMTGIIKEGSTYIKVRDFEKLGYTVEYSSLYGLQMATIQK